LTISGTTAISEYTTAIEYGPGPAFNALYVGEAKPGTPQTSVGWRIKRITYDVNNNATNVEWSSGDNGFKFIWANRATYTYS
jgi:hypothetical protein